MFSFSCDNGSTLKIRNKKIYIYRLILLILRVYIILKIFPHIDVRLML